MLSYYLHPENVKVPVPKPPSIHCRINKALKNNNTEKDKECLTLSCMSLIFSISFTAFAPPFTEEGTMFLVFRGISIQGLMPWVRLSQ